MHASKAAYLALLFSGAAANASRITPSPLTENSLVVWEQKTDLPEHLVRPRYDLIKQVFNRAWYFAAARISNIILRTVIEELERYNYISTNAHATALNIITSAETITHIALTTASVSGANGVQTAELGAGAGHVKIKRAAALIPNITHLSDWDISVHELHTDRNSFDNRTIIGDELHDWMVGNQTTNVAFMMYDAGGSVNVPILAYAADNDTLHFHIQYHPPTSNLTARDSDYQAHVPFFAANGAGIKLSMQNAIDPKSPPASQDDATAISKAVVNDWFYNRQGATYVGYTEVFTDNGFFGHYLCYVSSSTCGLLPIDTNSLQIPEAKGFGLNSEIQMCF